MRRILIIGAVVGVMMAAWTSEGAAVEGLTIGLALPYTTIGGDFEGDSFFESDDQLESFVLPNIDPGFGLGLLIGYGANERLAFELAIQTTKHDADWSGPNLDLNLDVGILDISLNALYGFRPDKPAQPYLLLGLTRQDLTVEGGAFTASGDGDVTYTGRGLNIGGGLDYFLSRHLSAGGRLVFRYVRFDEADGIDHQGALSEKLNGNGFTLMINVAYHFGSGWSPQGGGS